MAAIDEIVQVQISVETATIDKAGFGTPLIAAVHDFWPQLVRTFGSLDELTDAGVPATHPLYVAATKLLSQEFKVPQFKIGKRKLSNVQTLTLTPKSIEVGTVYSYDIAIGGGAFTPVEYTVQTGDTLADITLALSTASNISGVTPADNSTDYEIVTDNAGDIINVSGWDAGILDVEDSSTDPGVATDLSAIEAFDSNWYALLIDRNSGPEVEAAAGWAQARIKLFGADGFDPANADANSTSDTAYNLFANGYSRTFFLWDKDATMGYSAAAWMGDRLPTTPGSSTWKFKNLAGVTTDDVSAGERTALRNKKANFYHRVAGASITEEGWVSSGQFIDIIRGIDWLQAEVQTNVFALLASKEKVPFTDGGIDSVRAEVLRALNQGITNQLLAADPAPTVTAPKAADVSPVDKSNRLLPDVNFTATLAGAIHKVIIQGKVSV